MIEIKLTGDDALAYIKELTKDITVTPVKKTSVLMTTESSARVEADSKKAKDIGRAKGGTDFREYIKNVKAATPVKVEEVPKEIEVEKKKLTVAQELKEYLKTRVVEKPKLAKAQWSDGELGILTSVLSDNTAKSKKTVKFLLQKLPTRTYNSVIAQLNRHGASISKGVIVVD